MMVNDGVTAVHLVIYGCSSSRRCNCQSSISKDNSFKTYICAVSPPVFSIVSPVYYTANSIKAVLSKLKTLNSKRARNDGLSLK